MRIGGLRLIGAVVAAGLAAGLAYTAWPSIDTQGWWARVLVWIMSTQASLHQQLAQAMRAVGQEGWTAAAPLIGLSFLYGVFHAAGPGHGKAVMTAYLGTHQARPRQGLLLATLAALIQGAVAVLLVEIVAKLLGHSLRHAQRAGTHLENLSFALVALLGAVLAIKSAMALYRRWRHPAATGRATLFTAGAGMRVHCADCGSLHSLAAADDEASLSWRESLPVALATGARPCTGAILVLLAAYPLGLRWAGIAAVMAMSVGTALTVGLIAVGAVSARTGFLRVLGRTGDRLDRVRTGLGILGLLGGLFICLLGAGLLQQAQQTPPHPLM
ncbi:nickel/cobalt transporter [Castellaniella sp.]|uniref:nickel/cobalt transporter n=1 Tax=Castellaniella sp. TaxID=1955812 RepID=UPI002AFF8654|nr:hypothetical protein [Castellaniella sp.]